MLFLSFMLNVAFLLSFPIVLMYVRTCAEEVFDALMLSTPTLSGLREAVSNKLLTSNTFLKVEINSSSVVSFQQTHHARTLLYVISQVCLLAGDRANCRLTFLPQVSEKYGMQKDTIGKIYKKCKRG